MVADGRLLAANGICLVWLQIYSASLRVTSTFSKPYNLSRDLSLNMQEDAAVKLGEIHGSAENLIYELLEIQKCRIANRDTRPGQNLRFLRVPEVASWNDLGVDNLSELVIELLLTEYGECLDETNYVAVSYCWESPTQHADSGPPVRFSIRTKSGVRKSRCSSHILMRTLRYAISQKVPYIWIDQECINQADEEEKGKAVQSMDIVYSRSSHPIGLLNTVITDTNSIGALGLLHEKLHSNNGTWFRGTHNSTINDVFCFFTELASDAWFTRAWVYQEVWCSRLRMLLLIPSPNRDLDPKWRLGETPHEISLTFSGARKIVSRATGAGMNNAVESHERGNEDEGRDLEKRIRSIYGTLERIFGLDHGEDQLHKPGIAGFQSTSRALAQLHVLECRDVVDKIDILGNIVNYPARLSRNQVQKHSTSMSTSILALTLLNGHSGFFRRIEIFAPIDKNAGKRHTWLETYVANILDEARNAQEWYNDPISMEPRLSSVELTKKGLACSGWIWHINKKIALPELSTKYYPGCPSQYTCTIQEFGWDLAQVFRMRGYRRLEESILKTVGPFPSPAGPDDNVAGRGISNPTALLESVKRQFLDPGQWYNLLLQFVMYNGYVWAGCLAGETEHCGIFYFLDESDPPPTLFISTHFNIDDLRHPLFAYNFVVLEVEDAECVDGVKVLRCDGKWAGGLWYAPKAAMKQCLFPWARSVQDKYQ